MSVNSEVVASIRMIDKETDNLEVPAHLLVRTLDNLQQIVYLLAAFQEKQNIGKRFRIKDELQQLYTLKCQIPKPGSYVIPISLKPSLNSQLSLFTNYQKIIDYLQDLFTGITQDDSTRISNTLPDSSLRNRILRKFRELSPRAGENWQLGFSAQGVNEIILTEKSNSYIDEWLNIDTPEDEILTVTGELISINFDRNLIVIKYPPTHQEIECVYLEELEDNLIENRRELIQVTGRFTLDNEGHPIKLTDVTKIEPVDLSSILLKDVSYGETKLRFRQPLRLTPTIDEESSQLLIAEDININLYVFAYTREELISEINEQITMMWHAYAQAELEELSVEAQKLKTILLETLEEIN